MPDEAARRKPVQHRPPTASTVKELHATALRCGRPGCVQLIYRVSDTGARVLNSEVAHIHARREGGPRWNPLMTEKENRSYGNLILLCRQHASEIDATPDLFPPEMLREWKRIQVATQEQAARSLPLLDDAEVGDVMARSFGPEDLVAAIAEIMPFSARSRSRSEALDLAARRSLARRETRLRPVPADRREAVLAWMSEHDDPVVSVPEGQLRVLVAPMGAGKSEDASRWWDGGLAAAQADAGVEIPVWLDARQVPSGVEAAVTESLGRDPDRPCRVVIDDLDSVSPRQAQRLLDEARHLVRTWPRAQVLATSRPGVSASDEEVIKAGAWPVRRGSDLVRIVAGDAWWNPGAVEAADLLTRPLTAIAVAARLRKGHDVPVSRLALLRDLPQIIIEQERPDQATSQLWDDLARLAGRILSAPGPVTAISFGNEAQVWQLTDTGLVVSDDGTLRFALPLFEQHFGAQALNRGIVQIESAAVPEAFPRWRYAVAFAVSTGDLRQAEDHMLRMARINPAAVSWVLDEIAGDSGTLAAYETTSALTPPWLDVSESDEQADPAITRGRWLRDALQALIDGYGTCGTDLSRHRDGRLVQWGVQLIGEDGISLSESRETLPPPDLVVVNDDLLAHKPTAWSRRTRFQFPGDPLGRWYWARNRLRQPLTKVIQRRRLPLPPDSPLARERQWVLAKGIMRVARKRHDAGIPLADLREALDGMMAKAEESMHSTWRAGGTVIDSQDVRWIYTRLQRETGEILHPPWPAPDQPNATGGWQWQRYSPDLTRSILTEVMRDAVVGYRDLVDQNLAEFGWALGLNSVLPVRVEGTVTMPADDADGQHSSLTYELKPDRTGSREAEPPVHLDLLSQPRPGQPFLPGDSPADRRRTPFYAPASHMIEPPTGQIRPATNLAYEWLAADLHALGWLPQPLAFHD